jgi:hypothetical protein
MEQADGMAQTDFKGKRALVTGAGKGNSIFLTIQNIYHLFRTILLSK